MDTNYLLEEEWSIKGDQSLKMIIIYRMVTIQIWLCYKYVKNKKLKTIDKSLSHKKKKEVCQRD